MHLIAPLVSGITGAENGSVHLYRRGAAGTYVTYYTSFEGGGATTPTAGVTLDANGGGVFYVNEQTLCVVQDSTGATVRSFVAGDGAPSVEVISQSFTGTDYATGATGASKPLALATVLDLWLTNAGAKDFKVDIAGTPTTLREAFATVGAAFVNVKSEDYGAVGDGSNNDTSAIQSALDAASAAGGGTVYFPTGTYRTTSALTVAANVSLLGAGPAASIVSLAHATANVFTFAASNTYFSSVSGLRILASQANTGRHIQAHSGNKLRVENCHIGSSNTNGTGVSCDTAGSILYAVNSVLEVGGGGGTNPGIGANSTALMYMFVVSCKTVFNGLYSGIMFNLGAGVLLGCVIDTTGITSGTGNMVQFQASAAGGMLGMAAILGNHVTNPTGGTIGLISLSSIASQDGVLILGNRLGTSITLPDVGGAATKTTYSGQHQLQRDRGHYYVLSNAAAVSVEPLKYGEIQIERTNTDVQTVNFAPYVASNGAPNMPLIVVYNNLNHASVTGTITFGTGTKGITTFTVNANRFSVYFFRSVHYETSTAWVLCGSAVNLA